MVTNSLIQNRIYLTMIPIDAGLHISRVGVAVTGAVADTNLVVGIYDLDNNQLPNSCIFQTPLPSSATTGNKEAVVDWTIPEGGFFYMAIAVDGGTGVVCSAFDSPEIRTAGLQGTSSPSFMNTDFRISQSLSGGELPASLDIESNTSGNRQNTVNIWFRDV